MIDAAEDPVLGALTRAVVDRFAPERIVLFGSRARGDNDADSDYDVIVVLDASSHPAEAVTRAIHDVHTNVDVIVDTCERFERRRSDVGTLEYVADREGRVLYTRAGLPDARLVREPAHTRPESLQEWIARAESDLTIMKDAAASGRTNVNDAIVFHAHQGVEKLLKAAHVADGVQPPRTHNLNDLLPRLAERSGDDALLREACAGLQALWPASRYPHEPVPTREAVDKAVAWAQSARSVLGLGSGIAP
jgi:HEPN domain-containing protein/predicted nucleotidyltransferase